MSPRRTPGSLPDDVHSRPWDWEPICRAEAVAASPWEPVAVVTRGQGPGRHGVWFGEEHPLYAPGGAADPQDARYYRRRGGTGKGRGGSQAAAPLAELVRRMEKELGAEAPRRGPQREAPRTSIRLRLVDADTGEALAGIQVRIDGRQQRIADEHSSGAGQVQVPDVRRGTRFSVAFPGLAQEKARRP